MQRKYNIAVVGAGVVGKQVLSILAERNFPVNEIRVLASEKSVGKKVSFGERKILEIEALEGYEFAGTDIAFFSPGSEVSEVYVPIATQAGCIVIDKTSCFRMDKDVPLVIPEINAERIADYSKKGIIASPNCAVTPIAMVLKALQQKVKRVVVTTMQSVSGAGKSAMDELFDQSKGKFMNQEAVSKAFPKQIAFNILPHIGDLLHTNHTSEEQKIEAEIKKILENHEIAVTATCVRVPVFIGHSASVNIEFDEKVDINEVIEWLGEFDGLAILDDPRSLRYITPIECVGEDFVFISRIRRDESVVNGINLWVVTDNLRKGAALNAVQIAEELVAYHL